MMRTPSLAPHPVIRRIGFMVLLALGAAALLDTVTDVPISPPSAAQGAHLVDGWLQAMAGTDADRGWRYLSSDLRMAAYGGDESVYLAEVAAIDWETVRWGETQGRAPDGGFLFTYTPLLSDPRTLPHFLYERKLVVAICTDRAPNDILTNVLSAWFRTPRLEATLGGSEDCEELFYRDTGPLRPPADLVGFAWVSGGNRSIRVEVTDETGRVKKAGPGRDQPPLDGDVTVSNFQPDQVGLAWVGTDCPDPVQLIVRRDGDAIAIVLISVKGPTQECAAYPRTYEVMLKFAGGISADDIVATKS